MPDADYGALIKEARSRHNSVRMQVGSAAHGGPPEFGDVCTTCGAFAPCATARLADALSAALAKNERLGTLSDVFLSMRDRVAGYLSAPPAARQFNEGSYAFEWAAQNVRRVARGETPLKPPVPLRTLRDDDRQEDGWKHYVLTCETCGKRFVCSADVPVEHRVWEDDQSVRHYGAAPEVEGSDA